MEPNRLWHEPEVIIYGNLITPGIRCSAEAYDLANRRWYQLNVNSEVDDEEWMSSMIEKHISTYYHAHGTMPPFNVINTTSDSNPTTFESKPDTVIARPIMDKLYYNPNPAHAITTTSSVQIVDKAYLGRGVDRCVWRGRDCVFKRIEFDVDSKHIDREIKARENLRAAMDNLHIEDCDDVMEQRFNVIPILAVVLEQGSIDEVVGILLPFGGPSLESIFEPKPTFASPTTSSTRIAITGGQLQDLAHGVRELARAGVVHGDINDRNTLVKPPILATSGENYQEKHRLVMIDFGSVAPGYKTDAIALGQLFIWCKERASWDSADQRRIEITARILQESGDFDKALQIMDN